METRCGYQYNTHEQLIILSRLFMGPSLHLTPDDIECPALQSTYRISPLGHSAVLFLLNKKKENFPWVKRGRHRDQSCCHKLLLVRVRMLTRFPFNGRGNLDGTDESEPIAKDYIRLVAILGLTNPRSFAVLHFGLQDSCLNNCYYHQDL